MWQEQEQRPWRQGIRGGAEVRWRAGATVQEQEKPLVLSPCKVSRQVPSDCWDGRLRAHGVSEAVGKA